MECDALPTQPTKRTARASLAPADVKAGTYRVYVQFLPHADANDGALVLSRPFRVSGPGATKSVAVPAPSTSTTVDGYTVSVTGAPMAGENVPLTITVRRNRKPVTDLQPYLDTYAHVTAIHVGDLAFAHLHPSITVDGDHGGLSLTVEADLVESGPYPVFIQFQTADKLYTAGLSVTAS